MRWLAIHAIGGPLLRALSATWRIEFENLELFEACERNGEYAVFCFWHNRMLPFVRTHRNSGVTVLISRHGDGEVIARIIEKNGFRTVRGSSTRGGAAALKALIEQVRHAHVAITPDGPRGPRYRFKPGAIKVCAESGARLFVAAASADRAWRLKSWDRFLVPKPFARIRARLEPVELELGPDADDRAFETARLKAQDALNRLTEQLDTAMGWPRDEALVIRAPSLEAELR